MLCQPVISVALLVVDDLRPPHAHLGCVGSRSGRRGKSPVTRWDAQRGGEISGDDKRQLLLYTNYINLTKYYHL